MSREWKPGDSVPARFSGMPVTFAFNEVALTIVLRVLREHYPSGHDAMVDDVRAAMANFKPPTPPKPDEPQGLGAVVEDAEGFLWVRNETEPPWGCDSRGWSGWGRIAAVRVLSEGVS